MNIRRRGSIRTAFAATALTAAAAVTAIMGTTAGQAQGAAPVASAHAAHRTTLTVHVLGCDSCTVKLKQALQHRKTVWSSPAKKVGSDHQVTFRFATRHSYGMSFEVNAPWAKNTDSVPNAVTAYLGHRVGKRITTKVARTEPVAYGCWEGTTSGSKTLTFRVARITTKSHGRTVVTPLVFATHTMRVVQPSTRTFHGSISNQDAYYCAL